MEEYTTARKVFLVFFIPTNVNLHKKSAQLLFECNLGWQTVISVNSEWKIILNVVSQLFMLVERRYL